MTHRSTFVRLAAAAIAAATLCACGGGGGGGGGSAAPIPPSGQILVAASGFQTFNSSPSNRFSILAGTSRGFNVTESGYSGNFSAAVVAAAVQPGTNTCIKVSPSSAPLVFIISTDQGGPICSYPQTADIKFSDSFGNSTIFYVQAV